MNLEVMMDTMIGNKIKKIRKSQGLTQEAFCEKYEDSVSIDKYRLSALENGRREKNKNPHFLTEEYKIFFSKLMNVDIKTFIFGNTQEKNQLIKLILLNILMNGTTDSSNLNDPKVEQTPIFEFSNEKEFFRLSHLNLDNEELKYMAFDTYSNMIDGKKYSERELQERKNQIIKELQSFDNFFYNQSISKYYKLLMDGKQCFSKQSSILLKCLFGNFEFASDFLMTVENLESFHLANVSLRTHRRSFYIDNYLRGEGNFGSKATDWKETGYKVFVKAFNEFYCCHSEKFFEFFEENIFQYSYNIVSDSHIDLLFQSDSFLNVLNEIYEDDQYLPNRMLGHNFSRPMIQKFALIEERSKRMAKKDINLENKRIVDPIEYYDLVQVYQERIQKTYDIDRYLYDLENMTLLFADNDTNDKSAGLFLPEYFEITPLK
ncbi:helix-turn-helix transcriptional regulator [Staphylococcus pseudoxylosus]|uniref:helix-turn-helix transcriptional regulator n=1 Tax=Staphylococcus pseudoxylosus TaxID=2282419 RepID=UPI002DB66D34|nr:helix-turn-helix transcriptional regulator [Staphylococcus pseudoxylosus]MEB6046481.1 helix-turn-helix domain-containing protein [Staphylococcus pseudoxylosus]